MSPNIVDYTLDSVTPANPDASMPASVANCTVTAGPGAIAVGTFPKALDFAGWGGRCRCMPEQRAYQRSLGGICGVAHFPLIPESPATTKEPSRKPHNRWKARYQCRHPRIVVAMSSAPGATLMMGKS